MAAIKSRNIYAFFILLILCQSFKCHFTTRVYFKLIEGVNMESNTGNTAPIVRQEFFQCRREQSCTHVIQLANDYVAIHGSGELEMRKEGAICIYKKVEIKVNSCIDIYKSGMRKNGQYEIHGEDGTPFQVFCDLETEDNIVWTLVTSFAYKNNKIFNVPYYKGKPRNESNPNWMDYRLGLSRMKYLRSISKLWRATCNFNKEESAVFRDYVRGKFSALDVIELRCWGCCYTVEYVNIRGHEGRNVTVLFGQNDLAPTHIDSHWGNCQFSAKQGSVVDEDNFGNYASRNPAFSCTKSEDSTSQYWFGADSH